MAKTPKYDAKIKKILDATEPGERTCEMTGEKWDMDEIEIGWYKKFNMPPSRVHPLTRMKQHCAFFTMYQFWYQKHYKTGEKFFTVVHPMSQIKAVPDQEFFASDYSDHNRDYDSNRGFFEQMRELQKEVPIPGTKFYKEPKDSIALASFGDVNSNFVLACRSKNSLYSVDCMDEENSSEASVATSIQNSYHVIGSSRIFNSKFVHGCYDCIDCDFIFDCRNCELCFGATNKRNRKYLWFNEQLSETEWKQRRAEVDLSCRSKLNEYQKQFDQLMVEKTVWPENFNEKCTNVIGEYTVNAVDCKYVFNGIDGPYRDLYYVSYAYGNCYNNAFCGAPVNANSNFFTNCPINSSQIHYSHFVSESQNCEYCYFCWHCENCFGCTGLQHKKFCIFNKQYTEEEYWARVDQIKCDMLDRGEYGQYFPLEMSESYFFDSGAYVIYRADERDAEILGVPKYGPEEGGAVEQFDPAEVRDSEEVPNCIDQVTDEWVGVPLHDKEFKRRFAYIKPELQFYRKMKLAAPTRHFVRRVYDLMLEANTAIFMEHNCDECGTKMTITKNTRYPERGIYCKPCYLKYLEKYG